MKITLQEAVKFNEVYPLIKETPMPIRLAYGLAKILSIASKEQEFYRENYSKIIDKYAQKDKKGVMKTANDGADILIKPEHIEDLKKEIDELNSIEVDIPIEKFSISDFDEFKLSPESMMALMPFIEE